jgi:hypothetical protein
LALISLQASPEQEGAAIACVENPPLRTDTIAIFTRNELECFRCVGYAMIYSPIIVY